MSDEQTLLDAVLAAPRDDAPRLAYAAWCDAKGDPRGEFIHLTDDDFIALARSPHLGSLGYLSARNNRLGRAALDALAAARAPRLAYVDWFGNATDDPVDTISTDGGEVLDTWPTPLGQELEAKHGELAWLHAPWRFRFGYPPFPDAFD